MGFLSKVGGMFGIGSGGAVRVKPEIAKLNDKLFGQAQSDVQNIRDFANNPITGVDVAGQAALDANRNAYNQQVDQLQNQGLSNLATATAGATKYGMDPGANERLHKNYLLGSLQANQGLGAQNLTNASNIAAGNIQQQSQNQFAAKMGLPGMSSNLTNMQYQADLNAANAQNQANLANQAAAQTQKNNLLGTLGTVGKLGFMAANPTSAATSILAGGLLG